MSSTQPNLETAPKWRSASRCSTGDCVEVAVLSPDTIGVRDNKNPGGPILMFTRAEWNAFLGSVRESY
jgi:hypothetical protein